MLAAYALFGSSLGELSRSQRSRAPSRTCNGKHEKSGLEHATLDGAGDGRVAAMLIQNIKIVAIIPWYCISFFFLSS